MDDSGGTEAVNVSTGNACPWTAKSDESWISITAGASGAGNGTVSVRVARNDGKRRDGRLTIAGHSVRVRQDRDGKGDGKDDDDDGDDDD